MTDTSITRLGSQDFTPPEPIQLPQRSRLRARVNGEQVAETLPDHDHVEDPAETYRADTAADDIAPVRTSKPEPKFSLKKRLALLFAAIAVPAMAAPGEFGAVAGSAPTEAEALRASLAGEAAMPFERPGMSFPGSAFYYLDDPPADALVALPTADPLDVGAEDGRELGELIDAGPTATPFLVGGTGVSKARAQRCLAQAVWYEAASESEAGQRAVAQVVLNRVAHSAWPGSVCGVVYQGSQRTTGCQFSFTCDGSLRRKAGGASWQRAQRVAASALAGDIYAPIGLATHYHTLWVNPYWAGSLDHVGTIGAHRFYRNRGAAGRRSAFTGNYAGAEPSVRGRTSAPPVGTPSGSATAPLPDFSAVPGATTSNGDAPSAATSASATSGETSTAANAPLAEPKLNAAGRVKEKFSNAGKWKTDPSGLDIEVRPAAASQSKPQE